jgi:hypothetical protein
MNAYKDNLLSYRNDEYNRTASEIVDKRATKKYLDSCIVFIYNKENKNITPFLKEIEKYKDKEEEIKRTPEKEQQGTKTKLLPRKSTSLILNVLNLESKDICKDIGIKNIFVFTSDICGL